jgi:hypothetical protein
MCAAPLRTYRKSMCPVIVRAAAPTRGRKRNAMLLFQRGDIGLGESDRDLDGDCDAVVAQHELLQRLTPQPVVEKTIRDFIALDCRL